MQLATQKIEKRFFREQSKTMLIWLGMASAMVNVRGTIILIDPLLSLSLVDGQELCEGEHRLKLPLPIEAKDLPRVDVVLYTHADFDHFGPQTAQILVDQFSCRFIAPTPVAQQLREFGASEQRITQVNDDDALQIGEATIVVTPALHDWQEQNPWQRGDCCGFLIKTPDGTIWHPGDTRLIPELLSIHGVDVLFFDVADVEAHLGPAGSARLAESSRAKVLVANHYGTFDLPPGSYGNCDPNDCLPYIAHLDATFLQLNPGEPLDMPLPTTPDKLL
jgi:L-ascorbate metabolism protein UlaG (beta-lactamase superfamily)